jgi:DNA-binding NtrC family response regulator
LSLFYEVHTATEGEGALRFIHDNDVGLVILDLHMPGLSGFDVLKEIKHFRSDTEVIIITGYASIKNAQEAVRLGVEGFLQKPFKVNDIMAIVAKSFGRRRNNLKANQLTQQIKLLQPPGQEN